jgi:hypothetical protein
LGAEPVSVEPSESSRASSDDEMDFLASIVVQCLGCVF